MVVNKPADKPAWQTFSLWAITIALGLAAGYYLAVKFQPFEKLTQQVSEKQTSVNNSLLINDKATNQAPASTALKPATPAATPPVKPPVSHAINKNRGSTRLAGKVKTPSDDYEFDRIAGNALGDGKIMVTSYGATYAMSLFDIRKINFEGRNTISFEHKNGYKEKAELHCEPGDTVTFYSGNEISYYTSCETLGSIDEIEFPNDN